MSDVEGVTAEETTAPESVENTTPEAVETEAAEDQGAEEEAEAPEGEPEEQESEEVDWKVEAEKAKAKAEELEVKTKRQTAANRATQERYEEALAKIKDLELKTLKKPDPSDFETDADYDKAQEEYEDKLVDHKAEIKAQEIEAQKASAEQFNNAKEKFASNLEEIKKTDPDVEKHIKVVNDYFDHFKDAQGNLTHPDIVKFDRYLSFEAENNVALANYLGKNPDFVEDQIIGKPWFVIEKKLKRIEQELSAPKKPPETKPLPAPPSKAKGSASSKVDPKKLSDEATYMKWRNSQLKKRS